VSEPEQPEVWILQSRADRDAGINPLGEFASAIRARGARTAADRIAALPKRVQRELCVTTVRCPGGTQLARVYRVPTDGGRTRYVLIPNSRSHALASTPRAYPALGVPCWIEKESEVMLRLYCRCHAETQMTANAVMHSVADQC
jgi:hypothetical protein